MIKSKGKLTGYMMVRNCDGMPKIDKPLETPKEIWDTLTSEEKNFANDRVEEHLRRLND